MSIYFFDVFLRDARCAVIFVFVGGGGGSAGYQRKFVSEEDGWVRGVCDSLGSGK